jgi:hypothetical protein
MCGKPVTIEAQITSFKDTYILRIGTLVCAACAAIYTIRRKGRPINHLGFGHTFRFYRTAFWYGGSTILTFRKQRRFSPAGRMTN